MTVNNNSSLAQKQVQYDAQNATTDVKEINYIKQQAAAAPDHKLTKEQAASLTQALQNLKANQVQFKTDLQGLQASGQTANIAHYASYMSDLNSIAQKGVTDLESNNDLDDALTANGSSAGAVHDLAAKVNSANSDILGFSRLAAPAGDPNPALAKQQATTNSTVNPGDADPYGAGHTAAPRGVQDVASGNAVGGGQTAVQNTATKVVASATQGDTAGGTQALTAGYASFLSGTGLTNSPAVRKQFGEQVKAAGAASQGITDSAKTALGGLVDGWVGRAAGSAGSAGSAGVGSSSTSGQGAVQSTVSQLNADYAASHVGVNGVNPASIAQGAKDVQAGYTRFLAQTGQTDSPAAKNQFAQILTSASGNSGFVRAAVMQWQFLGDST